MKNFKEWLSYQLLSKSLLSARPFSFFYEESPDGGLGNQGVALFLCILHPVYYFYCHFVFSILNLIKTTSCDFAFSSNIYQISYYLLGAGSNNVLGFVDPYLAHLRKCYF